MSGKLITLGEARQRLGVSKPTMARLMKEQRFTLYENPLDKRQKLVNEDEIEAAKQPRRIMDEAKGKSEAVA